MSRTARTAPAQEGPDLGKREATYLSASFGEWVSSQSLLIAVLLIAGATALFGGAGTAGVAGVLSLVAAVALFVSWVRWAGYDARIDVHEKGLVYKFGRTKRALPFESLQRIWIRKVVFVEKASGREQRRTSKYTIEFDERKIVLDERIQKIDELGARLEEVLLRVWQPRVVAAFDADDTVDFGPFALGIDGVHVDDTMLPWSRIRRIDVADAQFVIVTRSEELKFDCSTIANVSVALSLAMNLFQSAHPARAEDAPTAAPMKWQSTLASDLARSAKQRGAARVACAVCRELVDVSTIVRDDQRGAVCPPCYEQLHPPADELSRYRD